MAEPVVDAPAVEPAASPETNAPTDPLAPKPGEKTYKVKIGGKEEVWSERKLIERAQKSEGAESAMKRAAQIEQAFTNFVSRAQDPAQMLALLSDPKALQYDDAKQEALLNAMLNSKNPRIVTAAKKWLYDNEVEPATLTEEQRKMRELERFKTEREKSDAQRIEQEKRDAINKETERLWNDYRLKIGSGLKAEGLPANEAIVSRIARKALLQRRAGQPADIPLAIKLVKEEWRQEFIQLMTGMTEDQILSMYPEETLKTINKAFLKRLKGASQEEPEPKEGNTATPRKLTKEESQKNKDFWKSIGRGTVQV